MVSWLGDGEGDREFENCASEASVKWYNEWKELLRSDCGQWK